MPPQLRLIKPEETRAQFVADARLRLWACAWAGSVSLLFTIAGELKVIGAPLSGFAAAAFLLWALWFGGTFLLRRAERYTIAAQRLEIERGILSRRYESIELWRVREILLEQTLVERMRGAGRITLLGVDAGQPAIVVGPVANARVLYDQLLAARPAQVPTAVADS